MAKQIEFEDDIVVVYNTKNEIVYKGTVDYCPYKDEPYTWDKAKGYYLLRNGYRMECIA